MTSHTEPRADAWKRRTAMQGGVDFTMMYVAHDAFNRDLARLIEAADDGRGLSPAAIATWTTFSKQLHTHHHAEDSALWPALRNAVTEPVEAHVLDEMEAEHAALDPRIDQIDAAILARNTEALTTELKVLGKALSAHMIHEESAALPLLEKRLGHAGWDAFGAEIREQQGGIKGGAAYLPWVLDGASTSTQVAVLKLLPPPARVLYRRVWAQTYRKSERLH
jgi:iron-sulfur cluster repair protein YtfE (RIC family)